MQKEKQYKVQKGENLGLLDSFFNFSFLISNAVQIMSLSTREPDGIDDPGNTKAKIKTDHEAKEEWEQAFV